MAGGSIGTIKGTIKIDYNGAGIAKANADVTKLGASSMSSAEALGKTSTLMLGVGVAVAGGFGLAVRSAANFEQSLSQIKAVSGATGTEMDALRAKALQLGKDTAFSASDAANAMGELAKAGVSTTDILGGAADATVALAAAGGIKLPEAANIAANAMNQFGLAAKDLPNVANQLAGAANASAIDVSDLGMALSQVGAVAHLAGVSFNDTATAIALMGNAGIKGSDAGTSLKTFLQNLIPTTKQQIELMKQLGIVTADGGNQFFDASGKVKSLSDVSQVLQTALKGMSKEQQLATLQTLFGTDAIRAAAILADQGAAGFDKMAGAMGKVSAADVAATRMNNLNGQMEQLKGSVETMGISIGSILLPKIESLVKTVTGWANAFLSLSPSTQATIVEIIAIAAAVITFIGVIAKIIQIVKMFQEVWIALNATFLFSPIGLIIIAIVALIAIIILIATKTTWFQTIWAAVWGFLKAVGAWFAGPFAGFFVSMWNAIWPVLSAIGSFFVAIWNGIVAAVRWAWGIISAVMNFLAPLFQAVFGLIAAIVGAAFAIISAIISVGVAVWKGIIAPALNAIWSVIVFVFNLIVGAFTFYWNLAKSIISAVWGFIGPYVTLAIHQIGSVISAVMGTIHAVWSTIWNAIKAVASAVWSAITSIISGAVNRVVSIIDGIKAMVDKVKAFFNQLKDAASGGVGSLISFVGGIPGRIIGALGDVGGMLVGAGRSIIQGLINGIKGMAGAVKSAIEGVLSDARKLLPFSPAKEGPFSGKGWTLYSGISMMNALATGITSASQLPIQAMNTTLGMMGTGGAGSTALGASQRSQSPVVNVAGSTPRVLVVADFGNGMRQVVKHEIAENPDLVAGSAAKGNQTRNYLSPGRAS